MNCLLNDGFNPSFIVEERTLTQKRNTNKMYENFHTKNTLFNETIPKGVSM